MNNISEFLAIIAKAGVKLKLEDGFLNLWSKDGNIEPVLLQQIKDNKPFIIEYLEKYIEKSDISDASSKLKITKYNNDNIEHIPLSYGQERLWFLDQLQGSLEYHIPVVLKLSGSLNRDILSNALQSIVSRHEILRTVIQPEDGIGYQKICSASSWDMDYRDMKTSHETIEAVISEYIWTPFDLSKDYMLRACLYDLGNDEYVLAVVLHHISSDGWSNDILVKEFVELYSSFQENRICNLEPLPLQYSDYALWQREYISGDVLEAQLSYWENHLSGVSPLVLPTDYVRTAVQSHAGSIVSFEFDKTLSESLVTLSQKEGVTLFMTLLAAFKVLLNRYSGQSDICVGTPIANRTQEELEGMIGFIVNTLALRTEVDSNLSFTEFLSRVKQTTLRSYDYQLTPFEKVVDRVVETRDISRSPLFQATFELQNTPGNQNIVMGDLNIAPYVTEDTTSQFDLSFSLEETSEGLQLLIEYCTALFNESTIERMGVHYQELLTSIVANPDNRLRDLSILTQNETKELLETFNATDVDYPKDKTIIDLFEEQVDKTPNDVAVVYEGEKLTYRELDKRSNQLARYLVKQGVRPENLVGICIDRSLEMIVGILGTLKSGGAYVPIDPSYPQERINYVLEDADIVILLSSVDVMTVVQEREGLEVVLLDKDWELISNQSSEPLEGLLSLSSLAYVIYTSGSTGKPKGVMVEHGEVYNLIRSQSDYYGIVPQDRVLLFYNFVFDASVEQIFITITNGASLYLLNKKDLLDSAFLSNFIIKNNITHIDAVPQFLNSFKIRQATGLKRIVSGGDVFDREIYDFWKAKGVAIYNMYGPSETTVTAIRKQVFSASDSSIGIPISNTQVYILNDHLDLVPIGVEGELCISGAGLARGYLKREGLTKEKYIEHPFKEGERLYRTGDLAKWLPDGNIEFIGRKDEQVKIRGYRIELGEIENVIDSIDYIEKSSVVVDSERKNLLCYYQLKEEATDTLELWPLVGDYYLYDEVLYSAMTEDKIRNASYKKAIDLHVRDKVVVDIGTGRDAILSRFCIESGAKRVYAIEFSEVAYQAAKSKVESLGLSDKIILIHGDAMTVDLPEQVDVCVSEILGSIGGSEGAVKILKNAWRFLKKDGKMIPQRSITKIAAVSLPDSFIESPGFRNVTAHYVEDIFNQVGYHFDLRLSIKGLDYSSLISDTAIFEDLIFDRNISLDYSEQIELTISENTCIDGFLLWLNVHTTSDECMDSLKDELNWLPVYFPVFETRIEVVKGDKVKARITSSPSINGINPDYHITGVLEKKNGEHYKFVYDSFHNSKDQYKSNSFYASIFEGDKIIIRDKTPKKSELRSFLEKQLPDYMNPSRFIELEEFPRTPNGKIDKKRLPDPELSDLSSKAYVAPRNETEQQLAAIWQELLGVDRVGIYDNFFGLGGHSLLIVRLISQLQNTGYTISVIDIFSNPTIDSLSTKLSLSSSMNTIPANGIVDHCSYITPEMVTLVNLTQKELEIIMDKIPGGAANIQDIYLLSPLQEGIHFHHLMSDPTQGDPYVTPTLVSFPSTEKRSEFIEALQFVINRHDVLRTCVLSRDLIKPVQVVLREVVLSVEEVILETNQELLPQLEKQICPENLWIDMSKAPLLQLMIADDPQNDLYYLILNSHHLIMDHMGLELVIEEIRMYMSGNKDQLLVPALYRNFIGDIVCNYSLDEGEDYFRSLLGGIDEPSYPFNLSDTLIDGSTTLATSKVILPPDVSASVRSISSRLQMSPAVLFHAAFGLVVGKCSNTEYALFGSLFSGRLQGSEGSASSLGLFLNTLPVLLDIQGSVLEYITQTKERLQDILLYEQTSLSNVHRWSGIANDIDLFSALLNYRHSAVYESSDDSEELDLGLEVIAGEERTNYPFTLDVDDFGDDFGLTFRIASTNIDATRIISYIQKVLSNLLTSVDSEMPSQISELSMLPNTEKRQLLEIFNDTEITYPKDKTIIDLFEEQVAKTPGNVAVVFKGEELTYKELYNRSNQLARYLLKQGVQSEDLVGICIDRSLEMIIGILGILKSGAAYVPIDPEYPKDRIDYMLDDAGIRILLSSVDARTVLQEREDLHVILLDKDWDLIGKESEVQLNRLASPEELVYVIYTSGSTGKPKGVMIEHGSLVNFLFSMIDLTSMKDMNCLLSLTTFTFDIFYLELFCPILLGSKVILLDTAEIMDRNNFNDIITSYTPEFIQGTPSTWQMLLEYGFDYSYDFTILSGGEPISNTLKNSLTSISDTVWNLYGPTETTIWSTICALTSVNDVTIGTPIANTQIYILDTHDDLVPLGVAGELCIGGSGLARGYLNREDLNKDKFIPNPFREGERIYKTGDSARWLPDGNIEFIGRKDNQVKIRGYRIELGEIESVLSQLEEIHSCCVLAKQGSDGIKRLIGYVVVKGELDKQAIQIALKAQLPQYMVPELWVTLTELPLTSNGKIDRKSLPDPELSNLSSKEYQVPRNEVEEQLVAIWQDLLGVDQVGVHDNFFELGGHSLLATRLVSIIRKIMDKEVPIRAVFEYPELTDLGVHLSSQETGISLPAITVQERPEHIPLSYSQERLWFLDQLQGSLDYHIPVVLRLSGNLDRFILASSLRSIVSRHEVLRTVIVSEDGVGYQEILSATSWDMDSKDLSTSEEVLEDVIADYISLPFDLSNDYMFRACLYDLGEEEYVLAGVFHHISSDGWSNDILVKEFVELYNSGQEDRDSSLSLLPFQYIDYALWQQEYLEGAVMESQLLYWESHLSGVSGLQLPTDYKRPSVQSTAGSSFLFDLDMGLSQSLAVLSQREGVTLFMLMLSAFKVLMSKYSGQSDICVGTPIANRTQEGLEGMIGFFVNTLALRSDVDSGKSFREFLSEVKQTTLGGYDHQLAPFEKVVDRVVDIRDMSRSPLFQVMFVLQNTADQGELSLDNLTLSVYDQKNTSSKYDLTFTISESLNGLELHIEYCTDLFREDTIERMCIHYKELLFSIVANPDSNLDDLSILTHAESQELLEVFNDTNVDYPTGKTIIDLFEEQVKETPDNVAVVYESRELTYRELDNRSNQLARYLIKQGVQPEDLVGICIDRSLDMIIGILGILKSGCAYVPIDLEYPKARIDYILEDASIKIVLSSTETMSVLEEQEDLGVILLDKDWKLISKESVVLLERLVSQEGLAYVIYTSGSTGKPKGVMIEHHSLFNYISYSISGYGSADCIYNFPLFTSLSFDLTQTSLYMALLTGGQLFVYKEKEVSEVLKMIVSTESITSIKLTPSHLLFFQDLSCSHFLQIIIGGEELFSSHLECLADLNPGVRIYNEYGPTEATIGCSVLEVSDYNSLPTISIGVPIANTQIYILDDLNNLVPTGVIGELCIGGSGLARGYLHREDLTREKFVSNPFRKEVRMYKTGDLARWLPDGNIEFIGRKDDQVKIRGYRIELGEIESMLSQQEGVKHCCVLAKEGLDGARRLIGYVVVEGAFDKQNLQNDLKKQLPEYMVPQLWVALEELPLNSNGKIDRKSLPDPEVSDLSSNEYVAPRNELEEQLTEFWQDLLGVARVGIYDNFFELGGHSLLATRLVSMIRKAMDKELPIRAIFEYPELSDLAIHLSSQQTGISLPSITVKERPERIPLSYGQERLWFLDQLQGSLEYHIPVLLKLNGSLSRDILNSALQNIVSRHEVLRTIIRSKDGIGYQEVLPFDLWELDHIQISGHSNSLDDEISAYIERPFDLSKDYMFRACLYDLGNDAYVLAVVFHHIASDGWSDAILVKEFVELYSAGHENRISNLPVLPVQYSDYALWQREYLEGVNLEAQLSYWEAHLSGVSPLTLPTDYARPAVQSNSGASISFELGKALSQSLENLSKQEGVTLFMTLLASFKILMSRYSGQSDICIGTVVANRTQEELEGLIGFFLNTLALRSEVESNKPFREFLKEVKQTTLSGYDHQLAPFEKVVDRVVETRDMSRSPLFDVLFALQNTPDDQDIELGDLNIAPYREEDSTVKFDFTFIVVETPKGLQLTIKYCTALFDAATIDRLGVHYKELLSSIIADPDSRLGALSMLTESETQKLLEVFNDTNVDYSKDKTIVDLFEEQVIKTPDTIALVFEGEELTYQELNERANQLAHYLQDTYALSSNDFVGIMLEHSLWSVVSILGILKTGAAYVPIDSSYPESRKSFIISDTGLKVLIIESSSLFDVFEYNIPIFSIDIELEGLPRDTHISNPRVNISVQDLAYVIYTSGSTGKPKGVMIEHHSLFNYISYGISSYGLAESMYNFPLFTSLSFDLTQTSIYMTLLTGGQLFIYREAQVSEVLNTIVNTENITSIKLTPSHLLFLKDVPCPHLLQIIIGGEELLSSHLECLKDLNPGVRIYNEYGPTEATIGCSVLKVTDHSALSTIPIGKPISNTEIYILDAHENLQPIGVEGELCVGGSGLARGYLNREDLTKKKFITHPFREGERIYKTGDVARWLPDGTLEFIGRKDDQVKIRGYRIELGEIENVINEIPEVVQNVVAVKNKGNIGDILAAYYVLDQTTYPTLKKITTLKKRGYPDRVNLYTMPNGMGLYGYNRTEMDYLYKEIFIENSYLKNGINIPPGACIIDIGANQGVFSVYARFAAEDVKLYSFEPLPPTYEVLKLNTELYGDQNSFKTFNYGLSSKEEEVVFTYYPNSTVLSSRYLEKENVSEIVKQSMIDSKDRSKEDVDNIDELLQSILITEEHTCKLKTLSQVIEEESIKKIDLLKIDVEKSELDVLEGIKEEDWSKIKQIVIEVHDDQENRLSFIQELLINRGFKVFIEQHSDLENTPLYDVYAILSEIYDTRDITQTGVQIEEKYLVNDDLRSKFKNELESKLPEYMVPQLWIELEELPLTSNGKIDKKRLPDPELKDLSSEAYVAPRNKIETQLAVIWEDLLGVDQVGVYDNFFELGGHSILAIQLVSRIQKTFDKGMDVAHIFEFDTLEKLSEQLRVNEDIETSLVIKFNEEGNQTPIFFAPPGGGESSSYKDLSTLLGKEQPSYAFQCPGLNGHTPILDNVEELAALFIKQMQEISPSGPYRLGGYSFGGKVALEMAFQLENSGFIVEELILFDAFLDNEKVDRSVISLENVLMDLIEGINEESGTDMVITKADLENKTEDEQLDLACSLMASSGVTVTKNQLRGRYNVYKTICDIEYYPKSDQIDARVTLFKGTDMEDNSDSMIENMPSGADLYDYGWSNYTKKEVQIHEIEGIHGALLDKPAVEDIAECIKSEMSVLHRGSKEETI